MTLNQINHLVQLTPETPRGVAAWEGGHDDVKPEAPVLPVPFRVSLTAEAEGATRERH